MWRINVFIKILTIYVITHKTDGRTINGGPRIEFLGKHAPRCKQLGHAAWPSCLHLGACWPCPWNFFAHNLPCNDNNSHRGLWEQPPQLSEFCQFLNDETIAVQHLKFTTHVYTKNYRLVYSLLKILATPLEYLLMYRLAPKTETIFECSHLWNTVHDLF